jgi:hypothetical protein
MTRSKLLFIITLSFFYNTAFSQLNTIDHWETIVFETDTWDYWLGFSAPPTNWNQPNFTPTNWSSGPGGIGYDDNDDSTTIPNTLSLYMRLDFNIVDTSEILAAILHADYDDAFVAYLNGNEIARANIGTVGIEPLHTDTAITYREAEMYAGGNPQSYLLLKNSISQHLTQGSNTLAIQVHNHSVNSSDMSARFFFSVGLDNSNTVYDPVPNWFITPFIATNLPLIKINTNGQTILDGTKITAQMQVIDNGTGNLNYIDDTPNGYDGFIGIEIRGASSTTFDKKGYGLETRDAQGDNLNVLLLGMPSENDWILHGPYSDKSLLRNFLTFHIGSQLGSYQPRVRFCELFLDNQYWGVYVLMEKIKRDGDRVDIAKLNPQDTLGDELTGGYIFKIDRDEGPDNGWYAQIGYGYYAYHHPNADDLHPLQKNYLKTYFQNFENMMQTNSYTDPIVGYRAWLDVPSFIDYMMMQEITRNIDAYRLSTFMYKEKDSDGGKIFGGPIWDFNLGFGNADFCDNGLAQGWAFQYNQSCGSPFPYFWSRLIADNAFRNDFNCRWQELRVDVLNTDTIWHFIDSMALELNDAQIRNFERWNILGTYVWPNPYIGQDYAQEIQYLKSWIATRLQWMDNNMIGSNANCFTATTPQFSTENLKVYPNPFDEFLSFELFDNEEVTVELFDMLGRNINTIHLGNSNNFQQLETQNLQAGIYFYSVIKNNQIVSKGKVLKVN